MNSVLNHVTSMFRKGSSVTANFSPILQPEITSNSQASQLTLLPAQTEAQKLAHFTAELDGALQSLDEATKQSMKAREKMHALKSELQDRNWWGAFRANFNGQTDKELANNVQVLGQSMETTQKVIRVMLQVQTQKGRLLHTFSDALVGKITKIQTDTQTLDGNQRAAALAFLEELHQQVQEQIRQQDLVEQHDQQLQELSQWQFEKNNQNAEFELRLEQQSENSAKWHTQKDISDAEMKRRLQSIEKNSEVLNQTVIDFSQWSRDKNIEDLQLREQIAQTEQNFSRKIDRIADSIEKILVTQVRLEGHAQTLQHQVDALQIRMVELERVHAQAKSISAVVLRHGLSLVAFGVAVAALALSACSLPL